MAKPINQIPLKKPFHHSIQKPFNLLLTNKQNYTEKTHSANHKKPINQNTPKTPFHHSMAKPIKQIPPKYSFPHSNRKPINQNAPKKPFRHSIQKPINQNTLKYSFPHSNRNIPQITKTD